MAIEISNKTEVPALLFKYVFMQNMSIEQRLDKSNSVTPKYSMRVDYRLYAVDEKGDRHYTNKVSSIVIDDYIPVALSKLSNGNPELIQAMQAIEHALANIIQDQTSLGEAQVI